MRRKLLLPALAACSMLAISAPVASAASLGSTIKSIQKQIKHIGDVNAGQTAAIHAVDTRVDTVVANLAPVLSALPTVATALSALADPVTGLRALNVRRPQLVSVTYSPSTDTQAKVNGSTPTFRKATRVATGTYLLDFGQDVSTRAAVVTVNTPGAQIFATMTNCGASTDASAYCNSQQAGSASLNSAIVNLRDGISHAAADTQGGTALTFTAVEIAP